ncbi:MAG: hypothetical protein ACSHYF_07805 [Verrucomicrobiaceae bacterium]
MNTAVILFTFLVSAAGLYADHPIPADSKSPWDYRGEPRTITRESHDQLFACKTYEELVKALAVAIKDLEHEPDCATPLYVASGCRLAQIRAYYLMGETEKADKLLERYAVVYRKADGTPDFGEVEVKVEEKE